MPQSNRLPHPHGSLINREQPVSFYFEGHRYHGYQGDNIASALAANDVWLLSRSFKYHRPRGILTMAGQDANTLVQLPDEPNVLADRHPISEGLKVSGQNYNGSLVSDRDRFTEKFARMLPVGFYYKAFFKPKGIWQKFWEPYFRKKAGLGKVNLNTQRGYYDKAYEFCDVAVIGAGPAGMAAATAAAQAGAEVILIDENATLGGALNYARFDAKGQHGQQLRRQLVAAIGQQPNLRVMTNATVNGWFADNYLPIICGTRMHKLRAREVIAACGMIEQPVIFRGNDLPGVMQGSAAQRLIRLYGIRPGKQAVVLTGNRDGYGVALDLLDAGVEVAAIADMRPAPPTDELSQAVREKGLRIFSGHTVYEALENKNRQHLEAAQLRPISEQGRCGPGGEIVPCDLLCMSPGYTPTYQLLCQAGASLTYDDGSAAFTLHNLPAHLYHSGSVAGKISIDSVLADARHTAAKALCALGLEKQSVMNETEMEDTEEDTESDINFPWPIFPHPHGKDFVDFDEDLQVSDIINAVADGYEHVQLVKRYSTVGMGPSQGRHSALATARLVADATGRSVGETGVTTARPPFAAEKLAHVAGRSFEPERHTAMHQRHLELGARMMPAGLWWRPAYYGGKDKRVECMHREALNVRNNVGLIDVSTLGGLELRGPDAGEFLNRIYTYGFAKQPVGRARYAVMCNEQGAVIDDGVACRFHDLHYYVTATSSGVDNVYRQMLWWNAQWRLDVDIANVTAAWSAVNIAGPRSREVMALVCDDVDLSAAAFPYMAVRQGAVCGIAARLIRVGFVGELGYEIHVPAGYGEALWDRMLEAGRAFGIKPFGVETQRLLRLEKGHIIIGQDTDSMSHPHEVHLAWAISRKKPFFIGGRSIEAIMERPLNRKLVGFEIADVTLPKPEENHLVIQEGQIKGRITSCEYSPILNRIIGMAYVAPEQSETGSLIQIRSQDAVMVDAKVTTLPFYDPENKRQEL